MKSSKIKGFFYPGNVVHGKPDYGLATMHCRDKSDYWEYDLSGHT